MTTNSGYTSSDTPIGSGIGSETGSDMGSNYTGSTESSGGTTGRAKETASTAVDQGKNVAGTAKEEAANVASTATHQARGVVSDAIRQVSGQVGEQATSQRDRVSETLRSFSDDLEKMASGQGAGSGMAADAVREVSDRARAIVSTLENREPAQLVEDVRDFARRRPGMFLAGALAAGVVAGRLFRATADGAAAASLAESGAGTGTPVTAGTTTGAPGVAQPSMDYTAPVPSLDADAGSGYGTGPGGTGTGDEVLGSPTLNPPSSLDSTSTSPYGQRTQDAP